MLVKQLKMKQKNKKADLLFAEVLLGILGAGLLGNVLISKRVKRSKPPEQGVMTSGEGRIRAG